MHHVTITSYLMLNIVMIGKNSLLRSPQLKQIYVCWWRYSFCITHSMGGKPTNFWLGICPWYTFLTNMIRMNLKVTLIKNSQAWLVVVATKEDQRHCIPQTHYSSMSPNSIWGIQYRQITVVPLLKDTVDIKDTFLEGTQILDKYRECMWYNLSPKRMPL